jgi:hypothetical protein
MGRKTIAASILVLAAMAMAAVNSQFTGMVVYEPGLFKTGTFAVCEDRGGYNYCEDRLFASCNGTLIEVANNSAECGGKIYDVDNGSFGESYMARNWTDPRPSDFITGWAAE